MKCKCWVFDLDGTIVDTSYGIIESVNLALRKENLSTLPENKIMPYIGGGAKKLISSVFKLMGIQDEKLYYNVCNNFYENYLELCDKNLKPYIDFNVILTLCSNKKILLSIFTNKDMRFTAKILKALKSEIPEVICPPTFPLKPDATGINYLITKYGLQSHNVVIVGDSIIDYQTAQNSNSKCILVSWGFSDLIDLKNCKECTIIDNQIELLKFLQL